MDLKQTKAAVEAMLFAHAEPVTAERLAGVLGVEEDAVSRLLLSLRDDYEAEDRGLVLLQLEDRWQLATKTAYAAVYQRISWTRGCNTPASPAALELLPLLRTICRCPAPLSSRCGRGFFVHSADAGAERADRGSRTAGPARTAGVLPHDGCIPAYVRASPRWLSCRRCTVTTMRKWKRPRGRLRIPAMRTRTAHRRLHRKGMCDAHVSDGAALGGPGALALLAVLLIVPAAVAVEYKQGEFTARLKLLGIFSFRLYPMKEKADRKKKKTLPAAGKCPEGAAG